jgi:hypothetical protein
MRGSIVFQLAAILLIGSHCEYARCYATELLLCGLTEAQVIDYVNQGYATLRVVDYFHGGITEGQALELVFTEYAQAYPPRVNTKPWTREEIDLLREQADQIPGQWKEITEHMPGRSKDSVRNFWRNHIGPNRKFTPAEDELLRRLVEYYGPDNWNIIGPCMPWRSLRLLRERWNNFLHPDLQRNVFLPDEDNHLMELVAERGSMWDSIAQQMPGRSPGQVKNRWAMLERKRRKAERAPPRPHPPAPFELPPLPHPPELEFYDLVEAYLGPSEPQQQTDEYSQSNPDKLRESGMTSTFFPE